MSKIHIPFLLKEEHDRVEEFHKKREKGLQKLYNSPSKLSKQICINLADTQYPLIGLIAD